VTEEEEEDVVVAAVAARVLGPSTVHHLAKVMAKAMPH